MPNCFVFFMFLIIALGACQPEKSHESVEMTVDHTIENSDASNFIPIKFDKGKDLFKYNCAMCHLAPFKEERPDLRTYFRKLNKDSVSSAVGFISFGRKDDSSFLHSYKDSLTKEEIENIVVYCWEASRME